MTHQMVLTFTYPSGAEEWECLVCGRRMILQWPPKYRRIVMIPGDETVSHTGGKGGLKMNEVRAEPHEKLNLSRWESWFESGEVEGL